MTEVLGSITPRLFSSPLVTGRPGPCGCGCALTPDTSYGFRAYDFLTGKARRAPWPWQRWLYIHGGELTPDGIPRFRTVIQEVGRQSGKTYAVQDLSLFWIFEEKIGSLLGTSTLTKYAKKPWRASFDIAVKVPELRRRLGTNPNRLAIRKAAGEEEWFTLDGSHYAIAASNAEGGRSMSNERVIADEFAKQYNYDAYGAAFYSMDAFDNAQFWALTTPDPNGAPYVDLRASALTYEQTGVGDPSIGLFSWSCPVEADPTDPRALAMANPTYGRPGGKNPTRVLRAAAAAVARGGGLLRTFEQEVMCKLLDSQDQAVNLAAWADCLAPESLEGFRDRVALVFDVAPSGRHATLYAAAELDDGRVRVEAVEAWAGIGCADRAIREIPALLARVRPRAFAWLPGGPGAAVGGRLAEGRSRQWAGGTVMQEIRGEVTQVCMGFSTLVDARRMLHSGDPLLDGDIVAAEKLPRGDGWVFSRRGDGDCDALYAAAGAAWLAQTLPARSSDMRVLLPTVRD